MSTSDRRAELRTRLIDAAEAQIAAEGLASLRARDLAESAGCAVGSIYTIFPDLHALALAVNLRTFTAMGAQIQAAVTTVADAPPPDRMVTMAEAYLDYALANPRRWRALFDVEMRADDDVPPAYGTALAALFDLIALPLRELARSADPTRIEMLTRALFSSIHGLVLLGVEGRISGVRRDDLPEAISFIVRAGCEAAAD
ncbi:TetR/AcrR family transcriptional regulator [Roseobacter sp. HKCCA0434]|uniref:TetR/AcrR family transcriptional regulator n=1 Tax=Roseobacter sp. HKCCA0434 TaxID=3079297 RepID=UPI00290597F9|nr:TetR/AcrR family transcriptional regulator [Roseobacter sp. HKCCA0434]